MDDETVQLEPYPHRAEVSVPDTIAGLIRELDAELENQYAGAYAFVVIGEGEILGASTRQLGRRIP